jgi:gamma-polyglutamate synthase
LDRPEKVTAVTHIGWIAACLCVVVLAGLAERRFRNSALAAVPIRIHVNGTRGKSTTTRLIHAALRQAGIPAIARCSGTAARILLPDGSELAWRRRGTPNIREMLHFLFSTRRHGARALVVECMAVHPELQWTAEHEMIRATHGVITNARADHTEYMGHSAGQVAGSLSNSIPCGSRLILGDDSQAGVFLQRASLLGTEVLHASAIPEREVILPGETALPAWLIENRRIALAVTRSLGIADETALNGMKGYRADPGAASSGIMQLRSGPMPWLDATAANDPESFDLLVDDWRRSHMEPPVAKEIILFNHRADRQARLLEFCERSSCFNRAERVWITGERPAWQVARRVGRRRAAGSVEFIPMHRLKGCLGKESGPPPALILSGNTKNFDRSILEQGNCHG